MDPKSCKYERVSNFSIGVILFIIGSILAIISLAILPVVGLLIVVPVFVLAGAFLGARRSKACAIVSERAKKLVST